MKKICGIFFIVILCGCGDLPLVEPGIPVTPFSDGFESGTLDGWVVNYQTEGYSAVVVTDPPAREGTSSVRFTIAPSDLVTFGNRSEIYLPDSAHDGTETWYGWSFMLDPSYPESEEWQVIGQFHDLPDFAAGEGYNLFPPTHPPVSFVYIDGTITLTINTPYNYPYSVASRPIDKGVWHDVVLRAFWSTGWDGYIEVWLDGVPLTPLNGESGDYRFFRPNLNNRSGNYLKIGIYRSKEITTTNIIYFDAVRIGTSFAEVAP